MNNWLKIQVEKEVFMDILEGLNNSVISSEEWTPERGPIFLECEEDQIIADVFECIFEGQGRWLIIFNPILPGKVAPHMPPTPIKDSLREVPERKPPRPARPMREFLHSMTKPWHGYYIKDQ